MSRKSIITVCGSGKFKPLIHSLCSALGESGHSVLAPPLHNIDGLTASSPDELRLLAWKGATFAHFNRIAKVDVCVIANPGGYLGASTTLELGYAAACGKLIIALRHDPELARDVLFDFVVDTDDVEEATHKINSIVDNGGAIRPSSDARVR